jgi:hypothetical protein
MGLLTQVFNVLYAIVDALKHPAPGFERAVEGHFRLKRARICDCVAGWLAEVSHAWVGGHCWLVWVGVVRVPGGGGGRHEAVVDGKAGCVLVLLVFAYVW